MESLALQKIFSSDRQLSISVLNELIKLKAYIISPWALVIRLAV
jgi:hypothetical protein